MSESPNPFESPHAVDPLNASEKWRPTSKQILVGMCLSGIVLSLMTCLIIPLTKASLGMADSYPNLFSLNDWITYSAICFGLCGSFGLPACWLMNHFHKLTVQSVFLLGGILCATITGLAIWIKLRYVPAIDRWFYFSMMWIPATLNFAKLCSPVAAFALYLAYLRRAAD